MVWLIAVAVCLAATLTVSVLWVFAVGVRLMLKDRRNRFGRCACGCTRMDSPTVIAIEHEGYRHETERCFPILEAI